MTTTVTETEDGLSVLHKSRDDHRVFDDALDLGARLEAAALGGDVIVWKRRRNAQGQMRRLSLYLTFDELYAMHRVMDELMDYIESEGLV